VVKSDVLTLWWKSFSIGQGDVARFVGIVLLRVFGKNGTIEISGAGMANHP